MKVRVVVERAFSPSCGLQVGDCFEVAGSSVRLPADKPFCLYAMNAVIPVLMSRLDDAPTQDWLRRKPFICCPDVADGVVMRLDLVEEVGS